MGAAVGAALAATVGAEAPPTGLPLATGAAPEVSIVTSTDPTGTLSPAAACSFTTLPETGEGISTAAFSVSMSTSGCSSLMTSPTATRQAATSDSAMPSPTSGSLKLYSLMVES